MGLLRAPSCLSKADKAATRTRERRLSVRPSSDTTGGTTPSMDFDSGRKQPSAKQCHVVRLRTASLKSTPPSFPRGPVSALFILALVAATITASTSELYSEDSSKDASDFGVVPVTNGPQIRNAGSKSSSANPIHIFKDSVKHTTASTNHNLSRTVFYESVTGELTQGNNTRDSWRSTPIPGTQEVEVNEGEKTASSFFSKERFITTANSHRKLHESTDHSDPMDILKTLPASNKQETKMTDDALKTRQDVPSRQSLPSPSTSSINIAFRETATGPSISSSNSDTVTTNTVNKEQELSSTSIPMEVDTKLTTSHEKKVANSADSPRPTSASMNASNLNLRGEFNDPVTPSQKTWIYRTAYYPPVHQPSRTRLFEYPSGDLNIHHSTEDSKRDVFQTQTLEPSGYTPTVEKFSQHPSTQNTDSIVSELLDDIGKLSVGELQSEQLIVSPTTRATFTPQPTIKTQKTRHFTTKGSDSTTLGPETISAAKSNPRETANPGKSAPVWPQTTGNFETQTVTKTDSSATKATAPQHKTEEAEDLMDTGSGTSDTDTFLTDPVLLISTSIPTHAATVLTEEEERTVGSGDFATGFLSATTHVRPTSSKQPTEKPLSTREDFASEIVTTQIPTAADKTETLPLTSSTKGFTTKLEIHETVPESFTTHRPHSDTPSSSEKYIAGPTIAPSATGTKGLLEEENPWTSPGDTGLPETKTTPATQPPVKEEDSRTRLLTPTPVAFESLKTGYTERTFKPAEGPSVYPISQSEPSPEPIPATSTPDKPTKLTVTAPSESSVYPSVAQVTNATVKSLLPDSTSAKFMTTMSGMTAPTEKSSKMSKSTTLRSRSTSKTEEIYSTMSTWTFLNISALTDLMRVSEIATTRKITAKTDAATTSEISELTSDAESFEDSATVRPTALLLETTMKFKPTTEQSSAKATTKSSTQSPRYTTNDFSSASQSLETQTTPRNETITFLTSPKSSTARSTPNLSNVTVVPPFEFSSGRDGSQFDSMTTKSVTTEFPDSMSTNMPSESSEGTTVYSTSGSASQPGMARTTPTSDSLVKTSATPKLLDSQAANATVASPSTTKFTTAMPVTIESPHPTTKVPIFKTSPIKSPSKTIEIRSTLSPQTSLRISKATTELTETISESARSASSVRPFSGGTTTSATSAKSYETSTEVPTEISVRTSKVPTVYLTLDGKTSELATMTSPVTPSKETTTVSEPVRTTTSAKVTQKRPTEPPRELTSAGTFLENQTVPRNSTTTSSSEHPTARPSTKVPARVTVKSPTTMRSLSSSQGNVNTTTDFTDSASKSVEDQTTRSPTTPPTMSHVSSTTTSSVSKFSTSGVHTSIAPTVKVSKSPGMQTTSKPALHKTHVPSLPETTTVVLVTDETTSMTPSLSTERESVTPSLTTHPSSTTVPTTEFSSGQDESTSDLVISKLATTEFPAFSPTKMPPKSSDSTTAHSTSESVSYSDSIRTAPTFVSEFSTSGVHTSIAPTVKVSKSPGMQTTSKPASHKTHVPSLPETTTVVSLTDETTSMTPSLSTEREPVTPGLITHPSSITVRTTEFSSGKGEPTSDIMISNLATTEFPALLSTKTPLKSSESITAHSTSESVSYSDSIRTAPTSDGFTTTSATPKLTTIVSSKSPVTQPTSSTVALLLPEVSTTEIATSISAVSKSSERATEVSKSTTSTSPSKTTARPSTTSEFPGKTSRWTVETHTTVALKQPTSLTDETKVAVTSEEVTTNQPVGECNCDRASETCIDTGDEYRCDCRQGFYRNREGFCLEGVSYYGKLKIYAVIRGENETPAVYTPELEDPTSKAFVELSAQVQNAVHYVFVQDPTAKVSYKECKVIRFRPGSIVAEFQVLMEKDSTLNETNFQIVLANAAKNGTLKNPGGLVVFPDSVLFAPLDECAQGVHDCSEHATCLNQPSGFSCVCSNGYRDLYHDVIPGRYCRSVEMSTKKPTVNHTVFIVIIVLAASFTLLVAIIILFAILGKSRRYRSYRLTTSVSATQTTRPDTGAPPGVEAPRKISDAFLAGGDTETGLWCPGGGPGQDVEDWSTGSSSSTGPESPTGEKGKTKQNSKAPIANIPDSEFEIECETGNAQGTQRISSEVDKGPTTHVPKIGSDSAKPPARQDPATGSAMAGSTAPSALGGRKAKVTPTPERLGGRL